MMYTKASVIILEIMAALIANLLKTCLIFLNAATHTYDQEVADKQDWLLLSTIPYCCHPHLRPGSG